MSDIKRQNFERLWISEFSMVPPLDQIKSHEMRAAFKEFAWRVYLNGVTPPRHHQEDEYDSYSEYVHGGC